MKAIKSGMAEFGLNILVQLNPSGRCTHAIAPNDQVHRAGATAFDGTRALVAPAPVQPLVRRRSCTWHNTTTRQRKSKEFLQTASRFAGRVLPGILAAAQSP